MAWLLRFTLGGFNDWYEDPPKRERIAKILLNDTRQDGYSVFLCESDLREVAAAGAWKLSKSSLRDRVCACAAIRINEDDLAAVNLVATQCPGETGLALIDHAHYEIRSLNSGAYPEEADLRALFERLIGRHIAGEDRIRRIGKAQLIHQFTEFLGGHCGQMNEDARSKCAFAINPTQPPP